MNSSEIKGNLSERNLLSLALARNTRIAYGKGWRCFQEFCLENGIADALSVSHVEVADFFIKLATVPSRGSGRILSMGTLMLYCSAINRMYAEAGKVSPTSHPKVRGVMKGLCRVRGAAPRRVKAMREYDVARMLEMCDGSGTLIGLRDAAIIALGFAGALRRSEICGLRVEDLEMLHSEEERAEDDVLKDDSDGCSDRMFIYIRKSKTDQERRGQKIAILEGERIKPIKRVQAWLRASKIRKGPLFQTMKRGGRLRGSPMHHSDIPRLIKQYAKAIGLDPSEISGHSLRAGFVTSAAAHRARLDKIMEITRHTNPATVMKYIRDTNSFQDHAGENFM